MGDLSQSAPLQNIDAEQSVLGGLLLDNDAWDTVADIVHEQDFSSRDHRMIFRAISHQCVAGKPADMLIVAEYLDTHNVLDDVGGIAYIGSLVANIPSAANIRHYAEMVRNYSLLRLMSSVAQEVSEKIYSRGDLTAKDLLDFAQSRFMSISESVNKNTKTMKTAAEVIDGCLLNFENLYRNPNKTDITGLPTGIVALDKMTTGMQPGELIILAARPSMGKTTFALNITEHVALVEKKNVAFFSLEMVNDQLGLRLLSSVARVHQQRVKVAKVNQAEFDSIFAAGDVLRNSGIFLDEESRMGSTELRARARRLHRECGGLHLIVIDYIGLMELSGRTDNRAIEIAEISRALKLLAKELHIPVLALSQLNRGLEQRPNKRPVMSDLRDSGGLEQDADSILFIYRDEVYNEDSLDKGIAEIIIAKQRNGPTGTIHTHFQGHLMRFENLSNEMTIPSRDIKKAKHEKRAEISGRKNQDGNEREHDDIPM